MNLFKTIWNFLTKKNVVEQSFIHQEIITNFAKKLDDMINFDLVLKGKLRILETFDAWAFEQLITLFLFIFGGRLGENVLKLIENVMVGFTSGDFMKAKESSTLLLTTLIDIKKVDNNIENIVIASQTALLFDIVDYYIDKQLTPS